MNDAVTFSGVSRSYGAVTAVDDLTLTIPTGETVALLGPNGAGKTTAISMLLDLIRPGSGTVAVLGSPPVHAVAAGRVGAMLQDGGLMPGVTIRELVDFARRRYPSPLSLATTLELAGLDGHERRRVDKLSGGQTQRLRFALAVAGDPALLILDEPTAALDVEGRRSFWASMRDYAASGRTLLFATHYLEEADANADRVVVLNDGRAIADGSAAEVKSAAGGRTVRFILEDRTAAELWALPGVTSVEVAGAAVLLRTSDADATVSALYANGFRIRDLEVRAAELEEAFLALTGPGGGSAAGGPSGRSDAHAGAVPSA